MAPSLCGNFVTDKRSLIAFTWTLTCVLTFTAFITCGAYLIHIHTTYIRLEHSYYEQWYNNYQYYQQQQQNQNNNDEDGDNNQQQQHSADREWENSEFSFTLNDMRSGSMTLISMYIFMITTAMTCYGSTAIVGFTSLRGIYIAPCFSSHDPATLSLKLGIFGGAIVLFANLLLICAVILGEVRVEDWRNNQKDEHNNDQNAEQQQLPYEIERIATVLAVTCMFLAALYSIFAILLFLYFGSKEHMVDDTDEINIVSMQPTGSHHHHHHLHSMIHSTPGGALSGIAMVDPRREKFITIHNRDPNDMVGQYELT